MDKNTKNILESKLTVYKVCYQHAEEHHDAKRMATLERFIDELEEKIESLN